MRGGGGFARRGGRALQSMAVRRCGARRWGGVLRGAAARLVGRQSFAGRSLWDAAVRRSFAGRDGAACGGSGAMGYGVRARDSSLHFFTFMGLIFVKYWVIMQM